MSIRLTQNSFSKGILSPSLQARTDLDQYSLGLKNLVNGMVLEEGCVVNRSGLEFVENTKFNDKKSRLIPFVFNLEQSYILEFGNEYIRFIKNGGYILDNNNSIYEITSPYLEDELFELDYTQQGDVLTITHKNHPPKKLERYAQTDWRLSSIVIYPSINPPSGLTAIYTGSTSSNTTMYEYVVCSVSKANNEESSRSSTVSVRGHLEAYWTTAEYITLSWSSVQGAAEYNVYRSVNGIFGYVGTTNTTSFKDNNIEPDLTDCAPTYLNPFEHEAPKCCCYYQQRKIYANSLLSPQTIWMSKTASDNNFNVSRPLNASDAITLNLYENTANEICHLIPIEDLIILTGEGEWVIKGKDGIISANPAPYAKIQSCYGSSKVKPVLSGSMILYVQAGGSNVRELGYNYLSDSYDGEELTLFARHLFEGRQIVDMAYTKEPHKILWCVMDDGTINALTYNKMQKIAAWHTHKTKGFFESVSVVREGNEDVCYFVVKREIDNEIVRYIERFKSRTIKSLEDGFFLDCAIKQSFNEEVSVIRGLNHLKNTEICAMLDYGVVENLRVNSQGTLYLPYSAKDVLIGIPYTFEMETLNFENTSTLGLKKLVNKVEVKIFNSREDIFFENDNNKLQQCPRCKESIDNPKKLFSKTVEFCVLKNPSQEQSIKLVQKYPLPINILAINTTLSVEEAETI